MLRQYLGDIGHFSIIVAFVSALVATYAYWQSTRSSQWKSFARNAFYIHTVAVIAICAALLTIIFKRYFEYHYAWDNSSLGLPFGYAISCFWQDQEGSFLLWMFWNAIIGCLIPLTSYGRKEGGMTNSMMTVFALVQVFLTSMILGVVIFADFKIGSSPFLLLKESMPNMPVWKMQPNFIPKDGNGLNPLLQNYWMVIHPPTLFLGFALTMVPFAYAIAGLWQKQYTEWIRPALPWALVAAVVLGTGIMMGGIWAYETLNFGGYWNWDPVENAVYVPWLVLVAGFHTMLLARRSSSALKYSVILMIVQFILILYSTFLTRSGILGNASVHSFTDLGLSGQLLVYLMTFIVGSIALCIWRWKELPKDEKEITTFTREFWIFMGVLTLCLTSFQVIFTTSFPVYNKVAAVFGIKLNLALPADQVAHYTSFQMWFFAIITVLTGIAQYFWWKKIQKGNFGKLINPLIFTLLASALIITFGNINEAKENTWKYIIILTTAIFGVMANGAILLDILKGNFKVAGGAITHIGVALMVIGVLFSAGYSKIVSVNTTTQLFNDQKANAENVQLFLNRAVSLNGFDLTYRGRFVDIRGISTYVPKEYVKPIASDFKGIAAKDLVINGKLYYKKGDTLEYEAENTYYQLEYKTKDGKKYVLFPRYQINQKMGNVASPDIKKFWNRDIYAHVNYVQDEERDWSMPEEFNVAIKDTFFLNDFVAILDNVEATKEVDGMPLGPNDAAAKATLRILDRDGENILNPLFVIKGREVWSIPVTDNALGLRVQLTKIDPQNGNFTFTVRRSEREFIVIKASEKPHINLLWLGLLLVVVGLTLAAARRFRIAGID
ncbi:MAG: cytochrome c biogenesis protein CcsA [Spirosomataceae bacterium]